MPAFSGAACLLFLVVASVFVDAGTTGEDLRRAGDDALVSVDQPHQPVAPEEEILGSLRNRRALPLVAHLGSSSTGVGRRYSSRTKLLAAIASVALALGVGGAFWKCLKDISEDDSGTASLSGKNCREATAVERRQSIQPSRTRPIVSKKLLVSLLLLSVAAAGFAVPHHRAHHGQDVAHHGQHGAHHHQPAEPTIPSTTHVETTTKVPQVAFLPPVKVEETGEGKIVTIGDGWGGRGKEESTVVTVETEDAKYKLHIPESLKKFLGKRWGDLVAFLEKPPSSEDEVVIWGNPNHALYTRVTAGDREYEFRLPNSVRSAFQDDANAAALNADGDLDSLLFSLAYAIEKGRGPTLSDYTSYMEEERVRDLKESLAEVLEQAQELVELL